MFVCVFLRYHSVQNSLTKQKSELQDAQMLIEFLEHVELKESQGHCREHCLAQVGIQKLHLMGHFSLFFVICCRRTSF